MDNGDKVFALGMLLITFLFTALIFCSFLPEISCALHGGTAILGDRGKVVNCQK